MAFQFLRCCQINQLLPKLSNFKPYAVFAVFDKATIKFGDFLLDREILKKYINYNIIYIETITQYFSF